MCQKYHILLLLTLCCESYAQIEDGGRYRSSTAILLLFVYGTILAGVVIRYLIELLHIPIPFQVFILILGVIIGYVGGIFRSQTEEFLGTIEARNNYLLIIALPLLIYKLCLCLEVHSFMRCILQVLIISIPCNLLNGLMVGFIMRLVENSSNWNIEMALMYGFTCIAIYPHETLMKLKDLGAKGKHLSDFLEGESIFGTATCIIMILVAMQHQNGFFHNAEHISLFIFQYIFGGFIIGCVSGFVLTRLIKMFYNDAINIMIISISAPFMVYYVCIYVFHTCGILALIMVGIFMSTQRAELTPEIDSSLIYFWELVVLIIDSVVFAVNGVVVGVEVVQYIEFSDIVKIGIAYMVTYFSRSATFILFSTILSRLEYGISFRHMVMAAWGGLRGAVNLCLVMISLQGGSNMALFQGTVLVHINGVVFLSLLINVPTIPYLLNCLGISNLSMARQHNMNNCVHHIMAKRDRVIALLKMDRFLADANWSVVDSSTVIKHPYKGQRDVDTDRDYHMGLKGSICPDCHKEVANQPTQKEIEEMRREARMRVLKAKKISYSRQYENGMLSKEALTALTHAVEVAQNNEDIYLKIDNLLKLFRKKLFLQQVRNYLTKYFHTKISSHMPKPPRKPRRRFYYRIFHHPAYICTTYIVIILNVVSSCYELLLSNYDEQFIEMCAIKALNWAFFLYFLNDVVLKIYGMSYLYVWRDGMRTYFKDWWHILDVSLLLVSAADLALDLLDILNLFQKYESFQNKTTVFLKLLRAIRLLRLITLCKIVYPLVIKFCDMRIDTHLSTVYDIGKGFVKGEEEVLGMLDQMIPNMKIRQEMRLTMERDKLAVTKELGLIQKEKPWIAITVKTKQAIRTILNNMETAIDDLRSSGWVDHIEYKKLTESLNTRRKQVRQMKMINSCPPKVIFQEIIWMADESHVIEFLFDHVTTKIYEPGDVIYSENQKPCGVIIIITGLFKMTYRPEKKVLDALKTYGLLPVIDFISSSKFDKNIDDYIVSGNCIGELSYLTGRPYNATIVADTPSQVYVLPTHLLEDAAKLSPNLVKGLKARIWKYISIRLAVCILLKTPAYVACSQERLRSALERCFVPDLENFSIFVNNTMIEDIILIEGVVVDDNTKENFIAPCYIPRTAQRLLLVRNQIEELGITVLPKLLVIPSKEVDAEDIMDAEEDMSDMFQRSDLQSVEFSRSKSSRVFRRRKRARSSFAESVRSTRIDFSDATSYSRSAAFSTTSRPTIREFELPDFKRRSLMPDVSNENTTSLLSNPLLIHSRRHIELEEDVRSDIRNSFDDVLISERAERNASRMSRKSILRIVTDVSPKQLSSQDFRNEFQEEEKENFQGRHPFSIDENESVESYKSDHRSQPKDQS
ncbi:sodium/hydrogen exchanger 10-like [Coccinella septempunctata]|uniref:sodium/hydrogen exchanger 10-like n=1 Tax=Coccinella septempunctata TaxID=41139 RepID=UPI001D05DEDE|nr:sodium/hydrogen exchanger 10-like [Coccinella septempunctata]